MKQDCLLDPFYRSWAVILLTLGPVVLGHSACIRAECKFVVDYQQPS